MMDRQRLHVIPEGIYTLELREQEAKVSQKVEGREYIKLVWDVVDGPYAAFRVWDSVGTSVVAAARIAQYAEAFGIGNDWDAAMELLRTIHHYVGRRIRAHVREHSLRDGERIMVIGRVFPLEGEKN
jgi:hypothetical protein